MDLSNSHTEKKVTKPVKTLEQIIQERKDIEERVKKNFSALKNAYLLLDTYEVAVNVDYRPPALKDLATLKTEVFVFFKALQKYSLQEKDNTAEGQKKLTENQLWAASLLEQIVFVESYAASINSKRQQEAIAVLAQCQVSLAASNTMEQTALAKLEADIEALKESKDIIPTPTFLKGFSRQVQSLQSAKKARDSAANNTLAVAHANCFRVAAEEFSRCSEYLSQRKELVKLAIDYLQLVKEMEGYSEKMLPPDKSLQKGEQKEKQKEKQLKPILGKLSSFTERRIKLIRKVVELKPKLEQARDALPAVSSTAFPEQKAHFVTSSIASSEPEALPTISPTAAAEESQQKALFQEALSFIQRALQTTHKSFAAQVKSIAVVHDLNGLVVDVASPTAGEEEEPLLPPVEGEHQKAKGKWAVVQLDVPTLDAGDVEDSKQEERITSEFDTNLTYYDQALENFQFASLVQSTKEKRRGSELVAPSHSRSASMSVSTPDSRSNSSLKPSTVDDSKTQSHSTEVADGKAMDTSGVPVVEDMEKDDSFDVAQTRGRSSTVNRKQSPLPLPPPVVPTDAIGTEGLAFFNDPDDQGPLTTTNVSTSSSPAMPQVGSSKEGSPINGMQTGITSPPGSSFPRVSQMPAVRLNLSLAGGAGAASPELPQLGDQQLEVAAIQSSEGGTQLN